MREPKNVVVGLDGSTESDAALAWAIDLASRRRTPLRLVSSVFELQHGGAFLHGSVEQGASGQGTVGPLRTLAEQMLEEVASRVRAAQPELQVSTRLDYEPASVALIEESARADTVVLGKRGVGGFIGLLLGSTTLHTAGHAHCTVVVVPAPSGIAAAPSGVVLGVDGSSLSDAAIDYAFRAAADADETLLAVHAWRMADTSGHAALSRLLADRDVMMREEQARLAESMAGWAEKYPDVRVERRVIGQHPVQALVEAAHVARLVVVGSRGRGTVRSALLESVSHGVMHHATCPVAVVRPHG
jgi:nucleotide-binding universal stress UspA family protein